MRGWEWLTRTSYTWGFAARVLVKASLLFILINMLFAAFDPLPALGRLSVYHWLVPARERLPYGEDPASYNLSLNSLEAMFSTHTVTRLKAAGEFRVLVMGDSSVWGVLLDNQHTLTGCLNAADLTFDGREARFYNLGHPILSVTKDLMLLDYAAIYQPDLVVWLVTLESLPYSDQLTPPLVANNADRVRSLIERYQLPLHPNNSAFINTTYLDETLVGQRRALADWLRLQFYGFAWASTGIDQVYREYTPRANNFEVDASWNIYDEASELPANVLAFEVLEAGHTLLGDIPLLIVNEPIYRADGANSDIRYNAWYPRWAYDQYRQRLAQAAEQYEWDWIDLWDTIAPEEFTDSPVHLTPEGSCELSDQVAAALVERQSAMDRP